MNTPGRNREAAVTALKKAQERAAEALVAAKAKGTDRYQDEEWLQAVRDVHQANTDLMLIDHPELADDSAAEDDVLLVRRDDLIALTEHAIYGGPSTEAVLMANDRVSAVLSEIPNKGLSETDMLPGVEAAVIAEINKAVAANPALGSHVDELGRSISIAAIAAVFAFISERS